MGFLDKAKQFLNIGGVKAKLKIGPDVSKLGGKAEGSLTLNSKSPQKIKSIKVVLERRMVNLKPGIPANTIPNMDNSITRWDTLGSYESSEAFDMQAGEEKVINFTINFNLPQTANEALAQVGGVLGAIGGLGQTLIGNQNVDYQVRASADVDKAALDATDTVNVRMI